MTRHLDSTRYPAYKTVGRTVKIVLFKTSALANNLLKDSRNEEIILKSSFILVYARVSLSTILRKKYTKAQPSKSSSRQSSASASYGSSFP